MGNYLKGASALHKRQFEAYVDAVGLDVIVRQPSAASVATDAVTQALGKPRPRIPDGPVVTLKAVISFAYTDNPFVNVGIIPASIAALGKTNNLDAILRCKLVDALDGNTSLGSRSIFDTCVDVVYDGQSYTVKQTERNGLPPMGPYILWVALKKNGVAP